MRNLCNMTFLSSAACVLLLSVVITGCSNKDPLKGRRDNVALSDDSGVGSPFEVDKSPVAMAKEFSNTEYAQAFLNSSHCYAPLNLSLSLKSVWSSNLDFSASKATRMTASPIIAEGKLFCIDAGGVVYALDQKTGAQIWRMSTTLVGKDGQIGGAIAYDGGRLVVTSSFAECFSLDAKTGKIIWRIKLPAACKGDGISVFGGKAFVLCGNSSLQVIDINNGNIVWSHSGIIAESMFLGSASVAVDGDTVFVAYPSGEIYALLLETGSVIWDSMFSKLSLTNIAQAFSHPRACPVVKDGIVYFVASNEQTMAFDVKTGKRLWSSKAGGVQTPSVSGNSIFILNARAELVCLNRYTGRLRWKSQLDPKSETPSDWYGQLLVKDHIAMVSPDGKVLLVSASDGKIRRMADCSGVGNISINPIVVDSVMYLLSDAGIVSAYK